MLARPRTRCSAPLATAGTSTTSSREPFFAHPWDVTLDEGLLALFTASFQDATPTYASRTAARAVGLEGRPVHPLLLLNLGLAFSVHDVSERAIAVLAYIDVRFPSACYPGDTVRAHSQVIGVKPVSTGDKGVVHVRTQLVTDEGALVCSLERKALVRAGRMAGRPADAPHDVALIEGDPPRIPAAIAASLARGFPPSRRGAAASPPSGKTSRSATSSPTTTAAPSARARPCS